MVSLFHGQKFMIRELEKMEVFKRFSEADASHDR